MYGEVKIRLKNNQTVNGLLLAFTTIPVKEDRNHEHKVIVYGIVETERGDFLARQLSEIKRR